MRRCTTRRCRRRLRHVRANFIEKRAKAAARLPEFEALRDSARDIKDHTLAHLDLYLEAYEAKVVAAGGHVHYAATAKDGVDIVSETLPGARRQGRDQRQVDDLRGDRPQRRARSGGDRSDRDGSRRIYHPASRRGALAYHRARRACQQGAGRGRFPPGASRSAEGSRPLAARATADRGARHIAREIPLRRHRRHRREFPDRRDRHFDHRHQRGQRRSHADPAQGPCRHRLARKDRADAGGRRAIAARARALGDRPGHVGLHDAFDGPAPPRAIPTGPRNITSSCSTTAARRCSAAISRTCCAASAAAPA